MRLLALVVAVLAVPCLAKDPRNCADFRHYQRPGDVSFTTHAARLARAVKTNLPDWKVVGAGYQVRCDEVSSNCGAMVLRSVAWTRASAGALVHDEPAEAWRGKTVELSGELRAGGVGERAQLVVVAQDQGGAIIAIARGAPLAGTTSFEKQAVTLEVPVEAARVVMGVELISEGAVFVRELSVAVAE